MKTIDVVVLTDARYVNPKTTNEYILNVLLEDNLVLKSLEKQGLKTIRLSWDDANFDWSSTRFILFRSTWDYFDRFEQFSTWLNLVSKQTKLINPERTIRWNVDKHYLLDLKRKMVRCVPTVFIEAQEQTSLAEVYAQYHFDETVLKPVISGAARHTYRINKNNLSEHESIFRTLISKEAMMLQPFQYNIVSKGEISLVLIDGKYTHGVLKIAKKGDFRVQDDFGGSVERYTPTLEEIAFAEKAVEACEPRPIYARVDLFTDNDNQIALAELELIEPELWFRNNPSAAEQLAQAIKKLC